MLSKKKVVIQDITQRARVSISTVSRVFCERRNVVNPTTHLYDAKNSNSLRSQSHNFAVSHFFSQSQNFTPIHQPEQSYPNIDDDAKDREFDINNGVNRPQYTAGQSYAILFSGRSYVRHVNDLEFLYRTLIDSYNFPSENIIVLHYDGTLSTEISSFDQKQDLWPGDNTPYHLIIDGEGSKEALQEAIKCVGDKLKPNDFLLLHTNGHGHKKKLLCYSPNEEDEDSITVEDFEVTLKGMSPFGTFVVMMEQCYSGSFKPTVLDNSQARSTCFAAAATESSISHKCCDGHFNAFANAWTTIAAGYNASGLPLRQPLPANPSVKLIYNLAQQWCDDTKSGDTPVYADRPYGCGDTIHLCNKSTTFD